MLAGCSDAPGRRGVYVRTFDGDSARAARNGTPLPLDDSRFAPPAGSDRPGR